MYTILITDANKMVTSVEERIMQKSKLVDALHFLVNPSYKGLDMTGFSLCMEYKLPVSHKYCSEILELSDELYKDMLEYKLPFDTNLTNEAGNVEISLTFTQVVFKGDGECVQQVRKISPTVLEIYPISQWSNVIPDDALTAVDQRLIKADTIIKQLELLGDVISETKADDLVIDNKNRISLVANGEKIGTEWNVGVPKINDGEYDGSYNGMLELDDVKYDDNGEPIKKDSDNDGDGDTCTCGCHPFVELDGDEG